jgi:hypothetical protein
MQLAHPTADPRVRFKVEGQVVFDVEYRPKLEATEAPSGSKYSEQWSTKELGTVKQAGKLMADIGARLGQVMLDGKHSARDITFTFQPSSTKKTGVSPLDVQLEGCKLVVVDHDMWSEGVKPCCPGCSSSNTKSNAWHTNAHSCKGDGNCHTIFVASKKRQCL